MSILDGAPEFKARAAQGRGEALDVVIPGRPGRWRVVFFYPRDFSAICPTEVRELSRRMPELRALGAEVVGVSVDDVETHQRWIREALGEVAFPLAADPDRSVARAYGALLEPAGVAARATFVVDPDGVVQHVAVLPPGAVRSISELVRVLEVLQAAGGAARRAGVPATGR